MQRVRFRSVERHDDGVSVVRLESLDPAVASGSTLPIWIGEHEAALISIAATAQRSERPITHDVVQALIHAFEVTLESVAITEVRHGVFHAHLLVTRGETRERIDCRAADAIALALREDAPLFVDDDVLRRNSVVTERRSGA